MLNGSESKKSEYESTDNQQAELEELRASLSVIQERTAALEKQLGRGTGDVTKEATAARETAARPRTLVDAMEAALRERTLSLTDLSKAIGEPSGKVVTALRTLRQTKKVANVGTEVAPRWSWRIGDSATTADLRALIQRLISEQPMTTAELVSATGARASRVSGCMVDMQRSAQGIMNLGTPRAGRWFMISPAVREAKLAPKAKK